MTTIPKVAIGVVYHRTAEPKTLMSALGMGLVTGRYCEVMPIECSGCYVESNRNGVVEFALHTGIPFDWLAWLDTDMTFPADWLLRLIAHDKDIVGANYRTRTAPHRTAGHYRYQDESHLLEPGLHLMDHLPTGLLLTRFDIYRKMPYPWFKPGLSNEPRDDVYFCHQALAMGYEIWCDHDLTFQVGHMVDHQLGWFNHDQIVRVTGTQIDVNDKAAANAAVEKAAQDYEDQLRQRLGIPPSAGASTGRNGSAEAGEGA